ncbi:HD domain-containing protein [Rhodococcus qingshengii]|nr:HD domain-containing protein [Rhodococcus qingshengii]
MILTSTCISGVNQGSIADLHQDIRRDASPTGRLFGMSNSDPIRSAFDQLPLKEMDAATLVFAIESAVDELAIPGETLRLAMEVATLAHLDQFRKNGIKSDEDPYIVHPLRNVLRLLRYGCSDVEILSATALHDTVEDRPHAVIALLGGQTADDMSASEAQERASTLIASRFGHRISELVEAVTNPIDYPCDNTTAGYQDHVIRAIADPAVFLVKLSDFVDNAGSVKYLSETDRLRLVTKYEPLVEHFKRTSLALGNGLHLPPSGLDAIAKHIATIERDFSNTVRPDIKNTRQ